MLEYQFTEIKCIPSKDMEIIESAPERLKLYDKHLEIQWKLTVKEPDENTGIKQERYYRGDKTILKNHVCSVGAHYSIESNYYKCTILTSNPEADYAFAFDTLKEALELKDKIQQWLLTSN
jgi:hypothetical protein